jgi:hypothetical protein
MTTTQVWTGKQTLYELIAVHADGRRVLVQYTYHKGLKHLYHALQDHREHIKALCGTLAFTRLDTPQPEFAFGEWIVRFSGRTQRDAVHEGELPFIRDLEG